jgi:hypothetical protein
MRNKPYDKMTLIDKVQFKNAKGEDGMVRIYVRPKLKYIGFMDTRPSWSTDPMDFVMHLNPSKYGSKKKPIPDNLSRNDARHRPNSIYREISKT